MICGCGAVCHYSSSLSLYNPGLLCFAPLPPDARFLFCYLRKKRTLLTQYIKGAMLEEPIKERDTNPPKMAGSACLIGAKTREEVVERLKNDVYVKEGVWNLDEVKIIPFKSALRKAL